MKGLKGEIGITGGMERRDGERERKGSEEEAKERGGTWKDRWRGKEEEKK